MINMIKLDWIGMKYYHKRVFLLLPMVLIYSLVIHEAVLIPIIVFALASFSVNPFAVEEKGKLDNLYLTLPVTRKSIVRARFGLSLIMQLIGFAIGITGTVLLSKLLYGKTLFIPHAFQVDFPMMLIVVCSSLLFYAVMNVSMFPVLFKIGYAKGKALGFYIPISVTGVIVCMLFILWQISGAFRAGMLFVVAWAFANTVWAALILLAMAAVILAISYILSCRLYAKRDF